jgi:lipoprotein-anchoring transpeptidase ErfK/SrfK
MRRALLLIAIVAWALFAQPAAAKRFVTPVGRDKLSQRALDNYNTAQARDARLRAEGEPTTTTAVTAARAPAGVETSKRDHKWIEVRLATQQLIAWQDGRVVMNTAISSGTRATPTVRGEFRVGRKYMSVRMRGADYDLPNVPFAMFFFRDYAIHGTYWHTSFGRPMSHGCINMPTEKAGWLFRWAPAGTLVVVH